jgi:thiol-disulfide isomerase/thioredoxin
VSRRLWSLVVVLVAVVSPLVACSGAGSSAEVTAETRYVSGGGTVTTVPPEQRRPAPPLRGTTLTGDVLDLASYRGRVVVLNVWGSWCPPCRKEAPDLVKAAKALEAKDVAFVGLNTRDLDPEPARAFVRTFEVPYPSVYDPNGEQLLGFRETLPANAIPSTLVIDTEGRVAARVLGPVDDRTLGHLVDDVVARG